jgi:hypothetical protein
VKIGGHNRSFHFLPNGQRDQMMFFCKQIAQDVTQPIFVKLNSLPFSVKNVARIQNKLPKAKKSYD